MVFFNFLTSERYLILGTAKLNQHIYFTSKFEFESKDTLLWKRGSAFVSTEDGNLQIPSRLMWFGEKDPRKVSVNPKNTLPKKEQETVWRKLFPNSQNDCLHMT